MWGTTPFDQLDCRIRFRSLRYEGRYTPPSTQGTIVYPGNFGTFNWGAVAVDPERQVVFAMPVYLAFTVQLISRSNDTERLVSKEGEPAFNENFGSPYAARDGPVPVASRAPLPGAALGLRRGCRSHQRGRSRISISTAQCAICRLFLYPSRWVCRVSAVQSSPRVAWLSSAARLTISFAPMTVTTGQGFWEDRYLNHGHPTGGQPIFPKLFARREHHRRERNSQA